MVDNDREILLQIIKSLTEQVAALTARVEDLTQKLEEKNHKKNSKNSSVPPSQEGYAKPAPKSRRKSSGTKPGGQNGHDGSSMKLMKSPDEIRVHYPEACVNCPNRGCCHPKIAERRYETDIVVQTRVIEHLQMVCCCPKADNVKLAGVFPQNITGTKQYGSNLKGLAVALSTVGMVSVDRIHKLLTSVFDITVSAGAVQNWIGQMANAVADAVSYIREKVYELPVLNCDETCLRVAGSLHWLHCMCNEKWSYMELHKKRGKKAMEDIGLLPSFTNTMIHDFWKPYYSNEAARHGLCNAHILRELVYAEEEKHQVWAKQMQELLLEILGSRKQYAAMGQTSFQEGVLEAYLLRYDRIVADGLAQNPVPRKPSWKRGRVAKGKVVCLLERLRDYKEDILLFARDWKVPFTNNEAERTIRFSKVKQKVSGCFRTKEGADDYMKIMSFLSTARKQGVTWFQAVQQAMNGNALTLAAQWV